MTIKINILLLLLFSATLVQAQSSYELLYLKGQYDSILTISQDLENTQDYYWKAIALKQQGKTLAAINTLENGITKADNPIELEALLSNYLYSTGQYAKAKPLLKKHSQSPDIFLKYINVLEFQEDYKLSVDLLKDKLFTDTANLTYLAHLAESYINLDSTEQAIRTYLEILQINAKDQSAAVKLANILIKHKDYAKAIEICNKGLANDAENKKLIKLKGIAAFNKKDFKTAEYCYENLYQRGDSSLYIIKHLGISKLNNSAFKQSRELLLQAYKMDSNDYEICFMLGRGFINSLEPEKGLFYFNRVDSLLQADPKVLSVVYAEKQSIYNLLNDHKKAQVCYQQAYKYNPKPEYMFYMAAKYHQKLNKPDSAIICYEKFLSLLPEKTDTIVSPTKSDQITITLKSIAERNIVQLKEELFFEGKLEEQ